MKINLTRKKIYIILSLIVCLLVQSPIAYANIDTSRSFDFLLTINGSTQATFNVGDEITLKVVLNRNDEGKSGTYAMYSMQDEIIYDSTYFSLLEDSKTITEGYDFNLATMDDGISKRVILSRLSFNMEGEEVADSEIIATFKLKALRAGEDIVIRSKDYKVNSRAAETYITSSNDVSATIVGESNYRIVKFDSNGGSYIAEQVLEIGDKVIEPPAPIKDGYKFVGWYRNEGLKTPWDFNNDLLEDDLTLYAKWILSEGGVPGSGVVPGTGETPIDEDDTEEPDDIYPSEQYIDVDQTLWYREAIDFVIEKGLFKGTSDTTFEPNTTMNRGMLVTVLWRLEGQPLASEFNNFKDVPTDTWYTDAVNWANVNKVVEGYGNGTFGPNDNITREQMVAVLYRYAKLKGYDVSAEDSLAQFIDVADVSDWALTSMRWAVAEGFIGGVTPTSLLPNESATRAQVATILMRYVENIENQD